MSVCDSRRRARARARVIVALVAPVAFVASACAQGGDRPLDRASDVGPGVALTNSEWVVASLDGRAPLAETRISLEFEDDRVGGYAGCNWYGGTFRRDADTLVVQELSSTARACADTARMDQEAAFLSLLADVRAYEVSREGRLELRDANCRQTLVLTRREALPMDPDRLVGTRWRLRSWSGPAPSPDTTATLDIDRDSARGFAGCRSYAATYEAGGDRIYVTSISMNETECALGEPALLAEGAYASALSTSTYYRLSGTRSSSSPGMGGASSSPVGDRAGVARGALHATVT